MPRVLPAEWTPQGAVLLIWPHEGTGWAGRLGDAEQAFGALAAAITRYQPLAVVCRDGGVRERALARLADFGCPRAAIATVIVDTDDTRARDIAPITVTDDGLPLFVHCGPDGSRGGHPRDRAFGGDLIDSAGFATLGFERAPLALEGGGFDTDGAGTLLANRPSILDPARNSGLDAAGAEALFARHFGIERTLWLEVPPLAGDDSDGHVDTLARFCDAGTIAYAAPSARPAAGTADPNGPTLERLGRQLAALRTADGKPYELVALPGPEPIIDETGQPAPASYTGFLVINGAVLVPSYADAADGVAVERLQAAFGERTVLPVPARTFAARADSLHRLTMQLPEGSFEDLALS